MLIHSLNKTPHIEHFLYVEDLEVIVYILLIISSIVFIYGLYRYYKRWTYGGQKIPLNMIILRIRRFIKYGLFQRKVLMKSYEGLMHVLIFLGIILLFLATILRAFEYDILIRFFGNRFLTGIYYLTFKLMANIAGIMVILGISMAFVRRIAKITEGLPNTLSDYLILLDLVIIIATGYVLDSINTLSYRIKWIDLWDLIGHPLAFLFINLDSSLLINLYRGLWLFHLTLALLSIAIVPYTKLSHIIIGGFFNVFFSELDALPEYKPIPNIEKIVEEGGELGSSKLVNTTWKERMDYDSCIKCARCHNVCPANLSEKPLSPMNLMLKLRDMMNKNLWNEIIVPEHVEADIIWACVTCRACVYECPLLINQLKSIIDIRRGVFASGENVPNELLQVSYNMMRTGNPYGFNPAERETWINKIAEANLAEIAKESEEYDYLYWTGCNVSYDPNIRGTGEALLKILKELGIKVGILLEERCCGEPARRIGDELMFTEILKFNGELLSKFKFKTLLVSCPHGYNVFKHEYPQYGYLFKVEHHSQLLARLIKEGKIRAQLQVIKKITYHDPCYLGRWNGIYDEPRDIIRSIDRIKLLEMPRNKERSFCCGGGGGHAFYEMKRGERISKLRAEEAKSTGADMIVVACPFCNIMLRSEAINLDMEVLDISEILLRAKKKS